MIDNRTWDQLDHADTHRLLSLDCLNCAINQLISVTELVHMPEQQRIALMEQGLRQLADKGINRNNCEMIAETYRIGTAAIGDENPYRDVKAHFNRGMMRLWPDVRKHIAQSADPLAAAVRAAIAGNLIDLAALGLDVSLEKAMDKVFEVDRAEMPFDETASLAEALSTAKSLLVLGDNCGEIAMDRILIETIRDLYPQLHIQYGVRGMPSVNDVTRDDAAMVGMEEVAEVIDNGDSALGTLLYRTSPEFNRAFYAADVIIAKGMGNTETMFGCGYNVYYAFLVKCQRFVTVFGQPMFTPMLVREGK